MTSEELKSALGSAQPPTLLDVRLEDDYAAARIPGATNARVFEVSFLDQVDEAVTDKRHPIAVYGFGGGSREAEVAAEKLLRAGYEQVSVYGGGLDQWATDGGDVEGTGSTPGAPQRPDGKRSIDLGESSVEWLGRNLLNKHWGTLGVKGGHLEFSNGHLVGGEITIDMDDMQCTDLAGGDLHDVLIDHLKSDDFFDVGRFPTATFHIRGASEIDGAASSEPNVEIDGELTLRGATHPLAVRAVTGITAGGQPAAQTAFAFDRTQWGVIYGSGKFFRRLAGHLVGDMVEMQLRVVCEG